MSAAYGVHAGRKEGRRPSPPCHCEERGDEATPVAATPARPTAPDLLPTPTTPSNRCGARFLGLLLILLTLPTTPPAAAQATPIRLLVLGDSLSAGYGLPHADGLEAQLQDALTTLGYNVRIIDGAVSGDTSAGGRARLDWVLAGGADAAIVELGANDGLRGLPPSDMQANLTAILDTLAAKHIPVLLEGMYAPPNLGPDYERAYRAVFDKLGQRPDVLYDPFLLQGVAEQPGLIQPDGLHPNAAGVRREVARILPLVEKLLHEVHTS